VHRSLLALLYVGAVGAGACSGASARPTEPPPPSEAIGGFWELADGSGVVMVIALVEGVPHIDAWSMKTTTDPEVHFDVTRATWDGRHLRASFTYPPTRTVTSSDLVLVNSDRLEGLVTGPYQATEVWVRTPPPDALTAPR